MLRKLLPKSPIFFDFFEQHAQLICLGAEKFYRWVSAPELASFSCAAEIKIIEREADIVAHNCIEALHKTFITPIDREDIHHLIKTMDDIIDEIEAAAARIALYKLNVMTPEIVQLAQVLQKPIQEVASAVLLLRDLKGEEIRSRCVKINFFENEMDDLSNVSVAALFSQSSDPLLIMKWKEIYEYLENAADRCEDVANILEGIVLEND